MERVREHQDKLQSIVDHLRSVPDEKGKLVDIQRQLRQAWGEFRELTNTLRPTLVKPDDLSKLDNAITISLKAVSIADQAITSKITNLDTMQVEREAAERAALDREMAEKAATTMKEAERLAAEQAAIKRESIAQAITIKAPATIEKKADAPIVQPSTSTATPIEVNDIPDSLKSTMVDPKASTSDESNQSKTDENVLAAILNQISEQYKEILAGKYPRRNNDNEDEPLLGGVHRASEKTTHHDSTKPQLVETYNTSIELPSKKKDGTNAASGNEIQQPTVELKMDKFVLPVFDGNLTNWLAFRDQFVDLVHNNPRYTPITKFIQLRNHLKGSALEAINGFKLSAADYNAAWYIITRRYDKQDRIIDEYIKQLDVLPTLTHPSAQALINIVNCTNQLIRVLPTLGVNISSWDPIIKYHITKKLDMLTHKKWLDQVKLRQNVPLVEIIEFLEVEATENLPSAQHQQIRRDIRRPQRQRNQGAAILAAVAVKPAARTNSDCPQCKGNHPLFLCRIFRKMAVKDRIGRVKGFKLCMRCLRNHEHPADCKFGVCPTCNKDHNGMLCFTKEKQMNEPGAQVASVHTKDE